MRPVVEALRADERAIDRDAGVDLLAGVGDDASFDQFDKAIAQHAGMDAQILAVMQQPQDRIGHSPNPSLDHRAVADIGGTVAGDSFVDRADGGGGDFDRWTVDRDGDVDGGCGNGFAGREGDSFVDFGDDDPRLVDGGADIIADQAAAMIALLIRWADLDQGHVAGYDPGGDQRADLAHMDGNDLEPACLGHGPQRTDRAHAG